MAKNKEKCCKIKDLEERLSCLKDKYDQLTDQLEATRRDSGSDEGILDYHQLIDQREILEKHMEVVENQLVQAERSEKDKNVESKGRAEIGCSILLVNSNGELKFTLVREIIDSTDDKQYSIKSPIGQAVEGKRVGDDIYFKTPKGKIHYKIESID